MQNDLDLNNIIVLHDVSKTYPNQKGFAFQHISLSVARGEFLCLIGPSGCGKSTILKIIADLEKVSAGTVKTPHNISMVFQGGALLPWLTVLDNAALGLKSQGMKTEEAHRCAHAYIEMLGLLPYVHKYPRELSGGQRQRIGIARALAVKPDVLLLDEPFSALDPKTTYELHTDILKIWKETKITIVMVSHSIEESATLGQRVILIKEGSIREIFPIDIPYPRHERGTAVLSEVEKIRRVFFE
jgi:NitT/TauT family transport system ATP-binding protein